MFTPGLEPPPRPVLVAQTPPHCTLFLSHAPGYTLFVEDESARANALLSRGDMEGVMVVHLAGRSAEKLVMGESEVRDV
jgi:hypothetical protein